MSRTDKGENLRLGDHALPAFLVRLLSSTDDLEHLLFGDTPDLGQRHGEAGSLLGALVLDGGAEGLGRGWVVSVEQVGRDGVGGVLVGSCVLDIAFLVGFDLLAHLDLLLVALLCVHFGAQAAQVLGFLGGVVALAGGTLTGALFMIEAATVQLGVPLHVLVLRLCVGITCQCLFDGWHRWWRGGLTIAMCGALERGFDGLKGRCLASMLSEELAEGWLSRPRRASQSQSGEKSECRWKYYKAKAKAVQKRLAVEKWRQEKSYRMLIVETRSASSNRAKPRDFRKDD